MFDESGRLISGGKDAVKPPAPEVLNTVTASLEDFTLPGKCSSCLCYSRAIIIDEYIASL